MIALIAQSSSSNSNPIALIAMAIAQFPPIFNNPWVAAIYYVIAGIGWVLPAMPLMRWMLTGKVRSH